MPLRTFLVSPNFENPITIAVPQGSTLGTVFETALDDLQIRHRKSNYFLCEAQDLPCDLSESIDDLEDNHFALLCNDTASLLDKLAIGYDNSEINDLISGASDEELKETSEDNRCLLHYAARTANIASLRLLINRKVLDVNHTDHYGMTPLLIAARVANEACLDILFAAGANIRAQDKEGRNFLHYLSQMGSECNETFKRFFDLSYTSEIHPFLVSNDGNYPAHDAASANNSYALGLFLDSFQFPTDLVNNNGDSLLHCATRMKHRDAILCLIAQGADAMQVNKDRELAVDYVMDDKSLRNIVVPNWTHTHSKKYEVVVKGDKEAILQSVQREQSESSSKKVRLSSRALKVVSFACAARGQLENLDALLDLPKMQATWKSTDNMSLLNVLCQCPIKEITEDPLFLVVLKKLLKNGASINDSPSNGTTCLHSAALHGNLSTVNFCLDQGAFLNSGNLIGMSELHHAVISGNEEIVSVCLSAGSDPTIKLRSNKQCDEFARIIGKPSIANLLSKAAKKEVSVVPNVAEVTFTRATDLLAKDETGLSDPFVVFKHHCGTLVSKNQTQHILQTVNPEWNETFQLAIRKNNIYCRDVYIEVFDYDEPEEGATISVNDLIGRTSLVFDPRNESQEFELPLQDAEGFAGTLFVSVKYSHKSEAELATVMKEKYVKFKATREATKILKASNHNSIGLAKKELGFLPQYPVLIIPGFASSALECWQAKKSSWVQNRVWLDPLKVFKDQSIARQFGSSSTRDRYWLQHLLTAPDGFSDPEGIVVRPVAGIHGTDFLITSSLAKAPSYVFGHLIKQLCDAGYTKKNLDAATYDWRLPPMKLEERDGYFSEIKYKVEFMYQMNKEKVVLMAHSMGNRTAQYFLSWVYAQDPTWSDKYVHAFMALGPPFLGASKPVRAVISGDCCGLEAFLTLEEGRTMHRGIGSVPWLLPVQENLFPDIVTRVRKSNEADSNTKSASPFANFLSWREKKRSSSTSLSSLYTAEFSEHDVKSILELDAPSTWEYYQNFYAKDPLYLGESKAALPAVLRPPEVKNLWVIMGVNLSTEVCYYFKEQGDRLVLDNSVDAFSNQKIAGINPRGLTISGGIGYESRDTFQPGSRTNKSGDGTVPYCSLNYAESTWRKIVEEENLPLSIQTFEFSGVEHRDMLYNDAITNQIINLVCKKPIG